MPSFIQKVLLTCISLTALTACNKTPTTNNSSAASTPVAVASIVASTPSQTPNNNAATNTATAAATTTATASDYTHSHAKIMSTAITGGLLISYASDAKLDGTQRDCLLQGDMTKAAPSLQAMFEQKLSAADKQAFANLYDNALGQRTLDFTTQSIRYAMGLENQEPLMNAADKAKVDAFNQSGPAQHLKAALDEKQVLGITLPVVNEQIKRCGFKEIPMQAIVSQMTASAAPN